MPYQHPLFRAEAYEEFDALRRKLSAETPTHAFTLRMCSGIRMAGCYSLLIDADAETFSQCLHVSARAFEHFLGLIPEDQHVVSRAAPLLDALACLDFDGAFRISSQLSKKWNRAMEYEEDFLFFQLLMELLFRSRDEGECRKLLEAYERVLEGKSDERLDVARALLDRDADAFDSALRALIDRHVDYYKRMRASGALPEVQLLSEGKVFVEGLALIRVAERHGLTVAPNYRLIPSSVRRDFSTTFSDDLWRTF